MSSKNSDKNGIARMNGRGKKGTEPQEELQQVLSVNPELTQKALAPVDKASSMVQQVTEMHTPSRGPKKNPILFVSSQSNPSSVAGAIAGVIREDGRAEVQAIGAGAVNQMVKAVAIARGYLAPMGVDLASIPSFLDVKVAGEDRTAIRMLLKDISSLH